METDKESNSDGYTTGVVSKPSAGQRGVTRRYLAVALLIFAMVYGAYALYKDRGMNEVYISTLIATGGGLLGIGRFGKGN